MSDVLYFNGRFTTTDERVLGVEDRGFQFGDAIYEVFKFLRRRPVLIAEHYRRLAEGLQLLEILAPFDEAGFRSVVDQLLERTAFDEGIVYTQISRGEGPRAHFYADDLVPTVAMYTRAFRFPDEAKKERGIRLITTRDLRSQRCDIKSVNLLGNAIAKKKAQRAGVDEALLIDGDVVREAASSSFFAIRGGRLITHPLDEHILPGVVRDQVISLALAARIRVDERPLREAELFDMDEAFITSTTMGVMPVAEIDGRVIGNSRRGEITTALQVLLDAAEAAER